jgi:hypothetical protein
MANYRVISLLPVFDNAMTVHSAITSILTIYWSQNSEVLGELLPSVKRGCVQTY